MATGNPSRFSTLLPRSRVKRGGLGGAELWLALLVVSVVAMMIVPLPTWLLDVLLATTIVPSSRGEPPAATKSFIASTSAGVPAKAMWLAVWS